MNFYPRFKSRPQADCPTYVNLDLWENTQVQECWAVEGNIGPELMWFLDGKFAGWYPKLTMERAVKFIRDFGINAL